MKLQELDKNCRGNMIYIFHIGREEALLLQGLLKSAVKNTPDIMETTQLRGRLRSMLKAIKRLDL